MMKFAIPPPFFSLKSARSGDEAETNKKRKDHKLEGKRERSDWIIKTLLFAM